MKSIRDDIFVNIKVRIYAKTCNDMIKDFNISYPSWRAFWNGTRVLINENIKDEIEFKIGIWKALIKK